MADSGSTLEMIAGIGTFLSVISQSISFVFGKILKECALDTELFSESREACHD